MRSILFEIIAFKESKDQYTAEERKSILDQFQERIHKATKKVSVTGLLEKINNS